jgi:hypothetical protein
MLRYQHRRSKDIDIFVPDPQYLGYVSPRLSDVAEAIATDYVEAANSVKLIRAEGRRLRRVRESHRQAFETWSLSCDEASASRQRPRSSRRNSGIAATR